jgi:hypothetical protein
MPSSKIFPAMKILSILSFHSLALAQPSHTHGLQIPRIEFNPKKYICYYTPHALTIDGKLNEAAWAMAKWTDYFGDIEGPVKPAPRYRTRVKMLWDDSYFYIGAELEEPDIWATLTNRDDIIFYDNDFEVFIDPDGDTHLYVELEINAFNTIWDLLLIQPYRDMKNAALHDWDIKGLKTGVAVYGTLNRPGDRDSCWTVEIAFPWSAFREITDMSLPPKDNDRWRINFSRVQWQTEVKDGGYQKVINPETNNPYPEDNWVWSPQGVVNMHYPEMWGYVQFTTEPVGGKPIPFIYNEEEPVKWFLRRLYYKQRNFFARHGSFTDNLDALEIELPVIPQFTMPPDIECTAHSFEASVRSDDGLTKIYIRNDGLIWKDANNN